MRAALLVALAALAAALLPAEARAALGPGDLLDRLEASLRARDAEAYLALWEFPSAGQRAEEDHFARSRFAAEAMEVRVHRPVSTPASARVVSVSVQLFLVNEPRATLEQWRYRLQAGSEGWAVVEREAQGRIEGLTHLSLDPAGIKADGLKVVLEDFELTLHKGTLFMPPEAVGPSALVFVGQGRVRFHPRPETEQEQLRHFCGNRELVETVEAAFVRLHPADLHRILSPARFTPDPEAGKRLQEAQRIFRQQSTRSFILDAALPGAPWWTLPGLGNALATFETARRGTLTLTVSDEAEGISLFDRSKRRQICLYPREGRPTRFSEDDGRDADVLSHDLRVRFEPWRYYLAGEDTLRLRLLSPSFTLRLRLDDGLRVLSVTSREGGSHLFFRVRNQDSLMVSLGPLAGRVGEFTLNVRYAGSISPAPIERELLEGPPAAVYQQEDVRLEEVLAYTNRDVWYPQASADDYATAHMRFEVPAGYLAVAGGTRSEPTTEGERTVLEYRLDQPGKYISVAVGHIHEATARSAGEVALEGFSTARTRSDAAATLNQAAEIIRFFSEAFGPCPYPTLRLVVVEGFTPGGHSPPGMVLLARRPIFLRGSLGDDPGSVSDAPDFFLAHELAHQWWGHGIAGENYHERWLSEAAAQYSAALWVRRSRGEEAFRDTLKRMGRWALARNAEGPINLGFRLGHVKGDPQTFRAVVYDKGAYVLHMLRGVAGEEAFRRALAALQAEHRYGKIGTEDVRRALEAASGRDLAPYFREWVYGTTLPALRFSHHSEHHPSGASRTTVRVLAEGLPGPVPLEIAVAHASGKQTLRVTLDPAGGSFDLETPTPPRKLELNSDRGLLAKIEKL